ncbi:hypothetical protein Ciccas_002678 [Cichlidogyrus casuarinus]|uniref:NADH dehydrogenase [ubiquinone] 1 beta subcomplex subunit 4 n=1 Tax=Cichlidogyrus casuarinus TaxID=1844966 RepID=A0ABD2QJS8_9PLAT
MVEKIKKLWDPWQSFYESPEEQRLIKERARVRQAMKAEYRKISRDPFTPSTGVTFDPAIQRWYSAKVTYSEYLTPNPKLGVIFTGVCAALGVFLFLTERSRNKTIAMIENGDLTYKERRFEYYMK